MLLRSHAITCDHLSEVHIPFMWYLIKKIMSYSGKRVCNSVIASLHSDPIQETIVFLGFFGLKCEKVKFILQPKHTIRSFLSLDGPH